MTDKTLIKILAIDIEILARDSARRARRARRNEQQRAYYLGAADICQQIARRIAELAAR